MTASGPLGTAVGAADIRLPLRVAASWGVGSIGTIAMINGVNYVLLFYLVTWVKLEPFVAGALLFATKILDVVTDPLMGVISDRTRSAAGRRRPYLLGASVVCGLSFALLFNVPEGITPGQTQFFIIAALVLYALSLTAYNVPYMAMPAEMTSDYHERTRIMSFRVVGLTLGSTIGAAFCPWLVRVFGNDRAAYGEMGTAVGVLIAAAMLTAFLGTRGAPQTTPQESGKSIGYHLRTLWANKPLLVILTVKVLQFVGIASNAAVMLFFIAAVLKKGPEILALFGIVSTGATILFTPLWSRLSRRFDKRNAYIAAFCLYTLVVLSWLLAGPQEPQSVFVLRAFVFGVGGAGLLLCSHSMLTDTMAHDFHISGLRREGLLSSAFSFVEKFSAAFGPLIIGVLLSQFGFDKSLAPNAEQPESAVQAMYIGVVWIQVAASLGCMAVLGLYQLDRSRVDAC